MSGKQFSRLAFAAGLALAAVTATAAPAVAAPTRLTLPALTGPYQVGTTDVHLVDASRADPWVPAQRRELMVTVDYPVRHAGSAPRAQWLPPGVASAFAAQAESPDFLGVPPGSVDWTATRRQARTGVPADLALGKRPVVLFSHGFGGAREVDSVLVDDLASRGYVVVSLSHTHEAAAVEFPGGRVEPSMETAETVAGKKKALDARVADTRFVLDTLGRGLRADADGKPLPRGLGATLDLGRVGMAGHSYGGFTAGEAMAGDRRIDAGVNLDGAMAWGFGPPSPDPYLPGKVTEGLDRPFLLFGAATHDHAGGTDRSWTDFWAAQRGWKRDITLTRGQHLALTDLQAVVPQLAGLVTPERAAAVIGTADPQRSLTAQRDYVAAFFDLHLRGVDRHLFDGPSPRYPEITFS